MSNKASFDHLEVFVVINLLKLPYRHCINSNITHVDFLFHSNVIVSFVKEEELNNEVKEWRQNSS